MDKNYLDKQDLQLLSTSYSHDCEELYQLHIAMEMGVKHDNFSGDWH